MQVLAPTLRCDNCEEAHEAVAECRECGAHLCVECRGAHVRMKMFKTHSVIAAGSRAPLKAFTLAEVHKHNLRHDAWTVIRGTVRGARGAPLPCLAGVL